MKKFLAILAILVCATVAARADSVLYEYTKSPVNAGRLSTEIQASTITVAIDYINVSGANVDIYMKATLSSGEEDLLDSIVAAHTGEPWSNDIEVIVKDQLLGEGSNKRLKWKGYKFTAYANQVSTYNFTMPYDGNIQGGIFFAGNSKDGDMIEMTLLPGTAYEYKYVETMYVLQGGEYPIMENFSMSQALSAGTPIQVTYDNTDSQDKVVAFVLVLRL